MEFLISTFLLVVLLLGAILFFLETSRTNKKLPPGPTPLPLIGNIHQLGPQIHRSLADLAKTHGPIMRLKLGQVTTIIISSSTAAKEVLKHQDAAFSNRFVPNAVHARNQHDYSVVWLPASTKWRDLRKVMTSNLFSNQQLTKSQQLRSKKVGDLILDAQRYCEEGIALDIGKAAFATSLNLLLTTLFSSDSGHEVAQKLKVVVRSIFSEVSKNNLADSFPWLAKFDPQGNRGRVEGYFREVLEIIGGLVDERIEMRRLKTDAVENDMMDVLLNLREEDPAKMDKTQIERMCLDLIIAGTDTTSNTLEWAMAELMHNPKTLEKAKAELNEVVGKGKPIEESDVEKLPYLKAIVKETLRKYPSAPFLLPRKVETDIEICGYVVPEGARVLVNAWAIGNDPSKWLNPELFVPERFLELSVDVQGFHFDLLPFGSGRRICPGMPLAMRMVHLMLGSLVNSFDWKLEGGVSPDKLDMEEKCGISLQKEKPLLIVPIR